MNSSTTARDNGSVIKKDRFNSTAAVASTTTTTTTIIAIIIILTLIKVNHSLI